MGEQDLLWNQLEIADQFDDSFVISAWIDNRRMTSFFTPEEAAILLVGGYWYDFILDQVIVSKGILGWVLVISAT